MIKCLRQIGVSTRPIPFLMIDASDGKTGKPDAAPVVTVSKNMSALGAKQATVTGVSNGVFFLHGAGLANDLSELGVIWYHITGTGAVDEDIFVDCVDFDPYAVPSASDNGTAVWANAQATTLSANVASILSGMSTFNPGTTGVFLTSEGLDGVQDNTVFRSGVAQSATSGAIVLAADNQTFTVPSNGGHFYIEIVSGTGKGQVAQIASYTHGTVTATINGTWATNPDATSGYRITFSSYDFVTVGGYATGQEPLKPTVAGRSLDVTSTGAAGIDLGNVEGQATALNLSQTTIKAVTEGSTFDPATYEVESGLPFVGAMQLIAAACAGILSGAGTGTITIKGAGVNTNRIVATTDSVGNRTSITLSI